MNENHLAIGTGFALVAVGALLVWEQTLWTKYLSLVGLIMGGWIIGMVSGMNMDDDGQVHFSEGA